jgi:hypothetical protein
MNENSSLAFDSSTTNLSVSISRDHLSRGCLSSFYLVAEKINASNEDVIET